MPCHSARLRRPPGAQHPTALPRAVPRGIFSSRGRPAARTIGLRFASAPTRWDILVNLTACTQDTSTLPVDWPGCRARVRREYLKARGLEARIARRAKARGRWGADNITRLVACLPQHHHQGNAADPTSHISVAAAGRLCAICICLLCAYHSQAVDAFYSGTWPHHQPRLRVVMAQISRHFDARA